MAKTKHTYTFRDFNKKISTTVTMNPDVINEWINAVKPGNGPRYIGFELEFHNNTSRIGTVQFCDRNRCLVIQLVNPPSLDQFLGDRNNVFVGVYVNSKLNLLRAQFPYTAMLRLMDLAGDAAPFLKDRKQTQLASVELGEVETDWGRHFSLSDNQVHYASLNLRIAKLFWNI